MPTILTINSGSSSLKLGLYRIAEGSPTLLYKGATNNIGRAGGSLTITDAAGVQRYQEDASHDSQASAFRHAAARLHELAGESPAGIGYRMVHGGPHLRDHCRITPEVLEDLRGAVHYAPLHIPPALTLIDTVTATYPDTPGFACFDTAFHRTMPAEAFLYPIPFQFRSQGVQRYGFHGLSYESAVAALEPSVPGRLVVAHLGNGASLCAIAEGRSVDTSMGFTPTGGIPMGTRSGDLDPGVTIFLGRAGGLDPDGIEALLNRSGGLLALSSTATAAGSADMRELTAAAAAGSEAAALAVRIFCRAIAKTVAGYAAVLGGLDCLVFTGGIGEHSAPVRADVCRQLAFLGLALDAEANGRDAAVLTGPGSNAAVRVLAADEEGRIAHHVQRLLAAG